MAMQSFGSCLILPYRRRIMAASKACLFIVLCLLTGPIPVILNYRERLHTRLYENLGLAGMTMKRYVLLVILSGLMPLTACKKTTVRHEPNEPLKVAATIFPLKDIISNIGGDKVTIITILPPGASPHTFEVRPETVKAAVGIKAIFEIGATLDDWAGGILRAMEGKPKIIDVSKGVALRKLPDGTVDPHYWLSLENGAIIAKNTTESLCELDPANKDLFTKNLAAYLRQLTKADEEVKKMLASLPAGNRSFATFHEAWFYFANTYGLKVAAAFEPFPGKEPTPEFLAEFTKAVKKENVKVIFSEPQLSPEAIRQIAKDMGVKLEQLDPIGGDSPQTQNYIATIKYNARIIYDTLSGK
jgi:zinc transport system substrate-binding protein